MKLEPIRKSVESFSVYVYVCMYVCVHVCVCVRMCIYVCTHGCRMCVIATSILYYLSSVALTHFSEYIAKMQLWTSFHLSVYYMDR